MNLQRINQFQPWRDGEITAMYLSKDDIAYIRNEDHYRVVRRQAARIANNAIRKMMR